MIDQSTTGREAKLKTLLISDLVESTRLVTTLGDHRAAELFGRHDRLARDLLAAHEGIEVDKSDGFLLLFDLPLSAVLYALDYHRALRELSAETELELATRVGIHLGEIFLRHNSPDDVERGAKPVEVEGLAKPMAARLMSLARAGQTLLTQAAFDLARRGSVGTATDRVAVAWRAHGDYLLKGVEEPVAVFEVGVEGRAPLAAPPDSAKGRRQVREETILGWRPAPGLEMPLRSHWVLESRVGEGATGEVWLAVHEKTRDRRVFKFCYAARHLKALKREVTLFRLLKYTLGSRRDINRILDWNFEQPPYFIESEYTEGGNLADWAEQQGGIAEVALEIRLEIVAQVAEALAAAHSVGVLHKDIKPANVLITSDENGLPRAKLTDFGIGLITDQARLAEAGITMLDLTELDPHDALATSGTRLYLAPELLEGKAATVQADIYALGIFLYQVVVADLSRVLAPGWEREVADELLRQDVACAVEGDPRRRLGNAQRLAERLRDLEQRRRQLAAERRAQAEADRARAQARKLLRRRQWMIAAMAALALFAAAMTLQARRIALEAARANREAETARQVSLFLESLFEVSDPSEARGSTITAREILNQSAVRIDRELVDQPEVRATLMNTMGNVYRSLGLYRNAIPLLENALATRRQVFGDQHLQVAESRLDLGSVLWRTGETEAAEGLMRAALAVRREQLSEDSPELADNLQMLGGLYTLRGDLEAAEPLAREALAIRRRLGTKHLELGESLHRLALLLSLQGDNEAAEPLMREALEMYLELAGEEHPRVATYRANLALILSYQGKLDEAESSIRQALATRREVLGVEHHGTATALNTLATVLHARGLDEAAEAHFRQSHAMYRRIFQDPSPQHFQYGTGLAQLAGLLADRGDVPAAEPMAREALEILAQTMAADHPMLSVARSVEGACMVFRGRYREAEPQLLESYDRLRTVFGDRAPHAIDARKRLVGLYQAWGKPESADEYRVAD